MGVNPSYFDFNYRHSLTMTYTGYMGAVRGESAFNLFFAILDYIKLSTSLRVGEQRGLIVFYGTCLSTCFKW